MFQSLCSRRRSEAPDHKSVTPVAAIFSIPQPLSVCDETAGAALKNQVLEPNERFVKHMRWQKSDDAATVNATGAPERPEEAAAG